MLMKHRSNTERYLKCIFPNSEHISVEIFAFVLEIKMCVEQD